MYVASDDVIHNEHVDIEYYNVRERQWVTIFHLKLKENIYSYYKSGTAISYKYHNGEAREIFRG